jgi:hypothetical protein
MDVPESREEKPTPATKPPPATDTVLAAEPILPLAVPVYPKAALAARTGRVVVGIRITIDIQGRVAETGPSPVVFSTPNAYAGGFREAVQAALAQWRFQPAVIQHFTSVREPNGEAVLFLRGTEKTDWAFDLAFTFTASGDVMSGLPGMTAGPARERTGWRAFFVRLFEPRVLGDEPR